MHLHIEESDLRRSDSTIHSLSWMGKVPDTSPDAEGWKLQRSNYYQEGWLAMGNAKGLVGATFTACHCKKSGSNPGRSNFNLRGHRSEVSLVRWNEPYQKLATCDFTGMIFVWIKHEGRWSIELINDRSSQVTDFSWSHDGRMALICYRDGFVLVGSVTGQRFWSSTLALDSCITTCAVWSPDDQQVLFGTSDGQVIVMSSTGAMLTQTSVADGQEIVSLAWSCEKFNLSEDGLADNNNGQGEAQGVKKSYTLAVNCHTVIYLMSHLDDICPRVIHTGLTGVKVEWSNDGELLAVGGFKRWPNLECRNELRLYNKSGVLRYRLDIEKKGKPLTALTWGHNDRRLFVAVGCYVVTVWLAKKIAPLQFLCHRSIQRTLCSESCVRKLPLPAKLRNSISALFCPTIKGYMPNPHKLREFVCMPPPQSERFYCTLMKQEDENQGGHYTLYLEFLGGLVPLLKGKRASKLRPEFVVYDPKIRAGKKWINKHAGGNEEEDLIFGSSESEDNLPEQAQTRHFHERLLSETPRKRHRKQMSSVTTETTTDMSMADLLYCDNLPESDHLLEITSNIWGTKFKIQGVASFLPLDVAMVTYKTSLLHLQPRQMTVTIVELGKEAKELRRKRSKISAHQQSAACPPSPTSTVAVQTEVNDSLLPSLSDHSPPSPVPRIHCHKHHFIEHCRHVHQSRAGQRSSPPTTTDCPVVVAHAKRPLSDLQLPPTPTHHRRQQGRHKCSNPYLTELENSLGPVIDLTVQSKGMTGQEKDSRSNDHQSLEDSPPPQLKSPGRSGFKSRSLSPAEQLSGPFIMDGGSECVSLIGREMFSDTTLTVKKRISQSPIQSRLMTKSNFDTVGEQYRRSSPESHVLHHTGSLGKRNPSTDTVYEETRQQYSLQEPVDIERSQISNHSMHTSDYDRQRWADRPLADLKYIDDDVTEVGCHSPEKKDTVYAKSDDITAKSLLRDSQKPVAEYSLSQLESQSQLAQRLSIPEMETTRRVVLSQMPVSGEEFRGKDTPVHRYQIRNRGSRCIEVVIDENQQATGGSAVSIDSCDSDASNQTTPRNSRPPSPSCFSSGPSSPSLLHRFFGRRSSSEDRSRAKERASSVTRVEARRHSMGMEESSICRKESASLPNSPLHKAAIYQNSIKFTKTESSKKSGMHSKLLSPRPSSSKRIKNYHCGLESSDEETNSAEECMTVPTTSENYSNLAAFQKAQLSKKMRKVRSRAEESNADRRGKSPKQSPSKTPTNSPRRKSVTPANSRQYLVMHNKAPLWNENSQVYQLDFGGRVTQESAKNFQIEYQGKQVMQFGRIDTCAYTLDFQYPFSAAQAFAVALANVTQRLK